MLGFEQLPGICDLSRYGSCGYHDRTHQHGPASGTPLPTLEVPVAGTGTKLIWIHGKTHRATRLAPFKTSFSEDPINPQFLARGTHTLRARNGNGPNARCDMPTFDVFGDFLEV